MIIKSLVFGDEIWEPFAEYAYNCSWGVGKILAKQMRSNRFRDWESVFVALDGSKFAGFCTLVKTDCIPDVPYTPYISAMFVDERYRGNRLSEKLISFALEYAGQLGFKKVYLVSNHVNLYEKYGFTKIDEKPAPWNPDDIESIFMREI